MARTQATGSEVRDDSLTGDDVSEETLILEKIPFSDSGFAATNAKTAIIEAKLGENAPCFTAYDCGEINTERVFGIYDSLGGITVSGDTTISFNSIISGSDTRAFSSSSGEIISSTTGKFWVTFDLSINVTNNSRSIAQGWLEIDSGSGFVKVDGTDCYVYNRISAAGEGTATSRLLTTLNIDDKIRVRAKLLSGGGVLSTIAGGSRLVIMPTRTEEDINIFGIDCGEVGEDDTFCNYDCGEI